MAAVIAPELHHCPAAPFLPQPNTNGAFKGGADESSVPGEPRCWKTSGTGPVAGRPRAAADAK